MTERSTRIRGKQIRGSTVEPSDLKASNSPSDGNIPIYVTSGEQFIWGFLDKIINSDTSIEIIGESGDGYIKFVEDNSEIMRITGSKVGIKTDNPLATLDVVGTARIGTGTGVGAMSPLEVIGTDGGIAVTSTNTETATEAYVAGFIKDSGGVFRKIGAIAFQFADNNDATGYGSWNVHTTFLESGDTNDDYGIAFWAKHGAVVFPDAVTAGIAPGDHILRINNGTLQVGIIETIGVDLAFNLAASKQIIATVSQDTLKGMKIINANAGVSVTAGLTFNNGGSPYAYVGLAGVNRATYINVGANILSMYTDNAAGMSFLVDAVGKISFGTNGYERMVIDSGGKVGIGMTPTVQFELSGSVGQKATGTTWANPSDRRLKENIKPFIDGLNVITKINPVSYELNGLASTVKGTKGISIIAQEVLPVAPYTIDSYKAKLNPQDTEETELYRFEASALIFALINSVKELNEKIKILENKK